MKNELFFKKSYSMLDSGCSILENSFTAEIAVGFLTTDFTDYTDFLGIKGRK